MPTEIRPQPGPQEAALASTAKLTIYGGAAGGGKTWSMVANPLRAVHVPAFSGMVFRRTLGQIGVGEQGTLWSEAESMYGSTGAKKIEYKRLFRWSTGRGKESATIRFDHLEHEKHVANHQGRAYPFIGFEELTHFTPHQFYTLLSRNRLGPNCFGITPWSFATCNPDRDSFVFDLVKPFLDDNLYPHPEMVGQTKYFVLEGDDYEPHFVDSEHATGSKGQPARSMTFIPALLTDNRVLMDADPAYLTELNSLPSYLREALLGGCWGVRRGTSIFAGVVPRWANASEIPGDLKEIRAWDRGSQRKQVGTDPDMSSGAKGGHRIGADGVREFWVTDLDYFQGNPADCVRLIRNTAEMDGEEVPVYLEEETGSSGKDAIYFYRNEVLYGFDVNSERATGDKGTRAGGWIDDGTNGRLVFVRGPWNRDLLTAMDRFPSGKRDLIDSVSLLHSASLSHPWPTSGGIVTGKPLVAGALRDW